ncbi:hypothetical protein [Deinococcus sp. YIM 77859]|uniref:hypothetical protein n=1 Tax=Deinococcus sp. YIM 77859 TaxID=1540221 RepID=UPI00068B7B9B|nr:hypothetical protein [Deinococcus sp. YIM 77859]
MVALAAGLPLTAGLVLAAGTGTASPPQSAQSQTAPSRPVPPSTSYADVFLQKLAAQLGITVERLRAAALAAGSATIDQAVQAGDLPSRRAEELKQRLQQNPFGFGGPRGFGRGGHHHGGRDGGPRDFAQPGETGQSTPSAGADAPST